jgi:protein-S-isoprenylcysteine O-methyltransferase Ste14
VTAGGALHNDQSGRLHVPRWAAPPVWIAGLLFVHVALPWTISLTRTRHGWVKERPRRRNLIGLILVSAGMAMIAWTASLHFIAAPHGWKFERTPPYMLVKGPYRFCRNPTYLLELVMWVGWAIFFGSSAVLVACVLWWIFFAFIMVPDEERQLESRFGEHYLQYKRAVPRWLELRWP